MKRRDYTCAAMPLGRRGGVCGAKPSEHNIKQSTVISATGVALPQHKFIPQEIKE